MLKCLFDRYDHHSRRFLAIYSEASLHVRACANSYASVHTIRLVGARHKEDQRDTRVLKNVFEPVDPIIATPVWDKQCAAVIRNLHEAGPIALWRAIEPPSASSREHQKWRGCNERAACGVHIVQVFCGNVLDRLLVQRRQAIGACDNVVLQITQDTPPSP